MGPRLTSDRHKLCCSSKFPCFPSARSVSQEAGFEMDLGRQEAASVEGKGGEGSELGRGRSGAAVQS